MKAFGAIAFTPAVQTLQSLDGSRAAYARTESAERGDGLGPREIAFLAEADSFFMATVSETGWPYVQHRGGPRGFLKVISPTRVAFADFGGNRQHVSEGNISRDDRVSIIVMDYRNKRLKLMCRLHFSAIEAVAPDLAAAVALPGYRAYLERVAVLDVEAFDWNCPQHITQRFTLAEIEDIAAPLHARIAELENEVATLRAKASMQTVDRLDIQKVN